MIVLRNTLKKLILLISIILVLFSFCITPFSYAKLEMKSNEFYYSGTQKGQYVAKENIFKWLLNSINDAIDWLIGALMMAFRAPFIGFTEIIEDAPEDGVYPKYYKEIFDGIDRGDLYNVSDPCYQWFRIESIESIDATVVDSLVVAKSGKKVNDIINTTRTAVMFIKNDIPIERLEAR